MFDFSMIIEFAVLKFAPYIHISCVSNLSYFIIIIFKVDYFQSCALEKYISA